MCKCICFGGGCFIIINVLGRIVTHKKSEKLIIFTNVDVKIWNKIFLNENQQYVKRIKSWIFGVYSHIGKWVNIKKCKDIILLTNRANTKIIWLYLNVLEKYLTKLKTHSTEIIQLYRENQL